MLMGDMNGRIFIARNKNDANYACQKPQISYFGPQ